MNKIISNRNAIYILEVMVHILAPCVYKSVDTKINTFQQNLRKKFR